MLEIEIDGRALEVADGSTVMDAAVSAGLYIPHFCYHKKLSIAANCRMCLVQVEKAPKALPACATPVTNGMKVWTHSENAIKAQKSVMEFLLINHPLDCPICDQGGECQLQDLAVGYGSTHSRYREEKRVVFNKNLGTLIATDMTRCISCTRCVRFTQEIAGDMELGQAHRGEHAEIMPFLEKTIRSELSGNMIDLCPVGALTSKPFRFSARNWEMQNRHSLSPHDGVGANLVVQIKHNRVKRVLPLENDAINECWLADRDRFSYEALYSRERIETPMIRRGGQWRESSWQEALEFVANGFKALISRQGAAAIGALGSPHATVEELYLLQKLMRGLGSENVDFRLRQSDFRADGKRSGAPWLGMRLAEVAELDHLLVVGSFLRKDAPLLAHRVRQAVRNGLGLSVVNPLADDWATPVANEMVCAPSEIAAVLMDIVFALADIQNEKPLPMLLSMRPEHIDERIRTIARALAEGERVAVWLGSFGTQDGRGAELEFLVHEIARLAGGRAGVIADAANTVGGWLAGAVPGSNGLNAKAMIESPLAGYVLLGAEPGLDFANAAASMQALSQAQLVVAVTPFASEAMREIAHVLLPAAPFTETSGTFVNMEGRAQHFQAVVQADGQSRPGWKILRALGTVLNLNDFAYNASTEVARAVLGQAPGSDGADVFAAGLDGRVQGVDVAHRRIQPHSNMLERIADVPIYFADALVRRAPALQGTHDARAPRVGVHADTLAKLGIADGARVRLRQKQASAELTVYADNTLAPDCARVCAAHESTLGLGAMSGEISLELV